MSNSEQTPSTNSIGSNASDSHAITQDDATQTSSQPPHFAVELEKRLTEMRRQLLDLTRRNPLLNLRPRKSQRCLRIVDEDPAEIYTRVCENSKLMGFRNREQAHKSLDWELVDTDLLTPFQPDSDPTDIKPRHKTDSFLQTELSNKVLPKRLLKLSREARSSLDEQGYNILFLALGAVEWEDSRGNVSIAPLVFVPVTLARKSVTAPFKVESIDDEVITNPCLVEYLKRELKIDFSEFDENSQSLSEYFAYVNSILTGIQNWKLYLDCYLGLFSFAKLLLYKDLELESWPESARLNEHRNVAQLLGLSDISDKHAELPQSNSIIDGFQVLDADSSQNAAIQAARSGQSFVIQGPPGTGKSQTITNIIAELIGQDKTVLFVAEKAAALEVVERRLRNLGLEHALLELHSHKATRQRVYSDLQKTFEYQPPETMGTEKIATQLASAQQQIDEFREQLTRPRSGGRTFADAIARLLTVSEAIEAPISLPVTEWDDDKLTEILVIIGKYDAQLDKVGSPRRHPWAGAKIDYLDTVTRQKLRDTKSEIEKQIEQVQICYGQLPEWIRNQETEATFNDYERVLKLAEIRNAVLKNSKLNYLSAYWDCADKKESLYAKFNQWIRSRSKWIDDCVDTADRSDWTEMLARRRESEGQWFPWLRSQWRRDNAELQVVFEGQLPDQTEQIKVLTLIQKSVKLKSDFAQALNHCAVETNATLLTQCGGESDLSEIDPQLSEEALKNFDPVFDAIALFRKQVQAENWPIETVVESLEDKELDTRLGAFESAYASLSGAWDAWLSLLKTSASNWTSKASDQLTLSQIASRNQFAMASFDYLPDYCDLNSIKAKLTDSGLDSFMAWAEDPETVSPEGKLAASVERQFFQLWIDTEIAAEPILREITGERYRELVEVYNQLDCDWIAASQKRLSKVVAERRPSQFAGRNRHSRLGVVLAEARKKRRHMPLRRLFRDCKSVVQSLKPCFLMSPLSVARYLAPGAMEFDTVIFDEASQVEPADAIGAIARAKQVILVGDENQLPPTSFFKKADSDDDYDAESFAERDLESILNLGVVNLGRQFTLKWHYRSHDASLIQFSNHHFYSSQLKVFPGTTVDRNTQGLLFKHVEDGVYDRGGRRCNEREAWQIAFAAMRHAQTRPEMSLGIGAFSMAQQTQIENSIEELRKCGQFPEFERFLESHDESEPFFVKNLETIQGDERDVILLSLGYGYDADKKITMNFGPLNREGGWRRLNVLTTRARVHCIVFASIRHHDFTINENTPIGVLRLKAYLQFAEEATAAFMAESAQASSSVFVDYLSKILSDSQFDVDHEVPKQALSLDLALRDPENRDQFFAGVMTDNLQPSLSQYSIRDLERIQPTVLQNLGWSLVRVHRCDYYRQPARQMDKLVQSLRKLQGQPRSSGTPFEIPTIESINKWLADLRTEEPQSLDETDDSEHIAEDEPRINADSDANSTVADSDSVIQATANLTDTRESGDKAATADQSTATDSKQEPDELDQDPNRVHYQRHPELKLGERDDLLKISEAALSEHALALIEMEGPIHETLVSRRICQWFEATNSGKNRKLIRGAIERLVQAHDVEQVGEYLQPVEFEFQHVRFRGLGGTRNVEFISNEELIYCLRVFLEQCHGCLRSVLTAEFARYIGFSRIGSKSGKRFDKLIDYAVETGLIKVVTQSDGTEFVELG